MSDVVLISGDGPYADPWHSFPDTSARLAAIVESAGYTVRISHDVEATLANPGPCRLLVINIGNPSSPRPRQLIDAARAGITGHLATAGAILAVHSSATSLTTMPQWPAILGGRWVHGQSMHWCRQTARSRIVYDGLGHDTGSYDCQAHVDLVRRATQWLVRAL